MDIFAKDKPGGESGSSLRFNCGQLTAAAETGWVRVGGTDINHS